MSEAKGLLILEQGEPHTRLREALEALDPVLSLPLFVIDDQWFVHKRTVGRRLLLMGESGDPIPDEIRLEAPLENDDAIYLGVDAGALSLQPFLTWDLVPEENSYGIDGEKRALKLITVNDAQRSEKNELYHRIEEYLSGITTSVEPAALEGEPTFLDQWRERRKAEGKGDTGTNASNDLPAPKPRNLPE